MAKSPRRSTGFEAWLNAATTPIYLLDKRRQVKIFNRGCEELTGFEAGEILGELCDYASPGDDDTVVRLLSALCPPPSTYEGQHVQAASFVPKKDGGTAPRMLHHVPLANRDGVIDRVLTFVLPLETPTLQHSASPAQQLHAELASLKTALRQRYGFSAVVAASHSMHRVLMQTRLAADALASVHFVGETGTGREHLARVAHNESEIKQRAFVPLDCERLTAIELLRTIRRMFDKQPGDASRLPHLLTGTLFLRSLEHLPRDVQQVLVENWNPEESEFPVRLMTSSAHAVNVLVDEEELLPELVGLTGTIEIYTPPLRQRMEDLGPLAQLFLEQRNEGQQVQVEGLSENTLTELARYNWPGNIAELRRVIDEAYDLCDGLLIEPQHLPARFRSGMDARRTSPRPTLRNTELEPLLSEVEASHIRTVLEACGGNRAEAARLLGITRPRLYRRMEQLGLD